MCSCSVWSANFSEFYLILKMWFSVSQEHVFELFVATSPNVTQYKKTFQNFNS